MIVVSRKWCLDFCNFGMMTNANNKLESFVRMLCLRMTTCCSICLCTLDVWQTFAKYLTNFCKRNLAPRNVMVVGFNSCGYFESVC